jgi:predicted alpha/beta superfamily hydrolase
MGHARIAYEGSFRSQSLTTDRFIRVYLPASYNGERKQRYPVLYVHDGQNAFSAVGDHVAFGWGNWRLDQAADQLAQAGSMREIIMVAIDCGSERYQEYRGPTATAVSADWPCRDPRARTSTDLFERYSRFLGQELKPKIDREYRTQPGPRHTGSLGSSMGGVCSLALGWQAPDVFGLVASLSGAFQIERRAFLKVLRLYTGAVKPLRIYLDSGVVDYSGGDDGRRDTEAVAQELRRIGWKDRVNLQHFVDEQPLPDSELERAGLRRDKWDEARTSQHNEFYWRLRAWRPLTFLFPPAKPQSMPLMQT